METSGDELDKDGDVVIMDMQNTPTKKSRDKTKRLLQPNPKSTPMKRKSLSMLLNGSPTPKPTTPLEQVETGAPLIRNADRSARKKSVRRLLKRTVNGEESDDEVIGENDELAERIFSQSGENQKGEDTSEHEQEDELHEASEIPEIPETPSKRGRGRPKGSKNKRTPTPPRHMPPYEHYFFQNRGGGIKTSNNTLSSLSLLSHEDYFTLMQQYKDPHKPEIDILHSLHRRSFEQWTFELEEQFNLCVYGWGSKRKLLLDFAEQLSKAKPSSMIIVINGFKATITARDIFHNLAESVPALSGEMQNKLGAQPGDMLNNILNALHSKPPTTPITLIVHSIDSGSLRRSSTQALLARLASSPYINMVASADTPHFPLLWDAATRAQFNWVFHDVTTFQSFDIEIEAGAAGGVVEEVNTLLGRSGRKLHGREGVMYVLRSLTESARNLFALLVAELLAIEDDPNDEGVAGSSGYADNDEEEDDDDNDFEAALTGTGASKSKSKHDANIAAGTIRATIPLRTLYSKAVAQLIATSELFFRELLKEFHDHQMVVTKKDMLGTEVLGVPFRREEAELVLTELAIGAD